LRERRHDQPLVAADARRRDEAFLLQPMQRAPHRRATQAEPLNHGALGDPSPWRQLAGDDQSAQLLVDARDVVVSLGDERKIPSRGTVRGWRGSVSAGTASL
jgi:hypothetical protein